MCDCRRRLPTSFAALLLGVSSQCFPASAAHADDVAIGLGAGDGFSVEDSGQAGRLRVDDATRKIEARWPTTVTVLPPGQGGDAEAGQVGLALSSGSSGGVSTRPLTVCREGDVNRCTFFNSDGAYLTPTYIIIDGTVRSEYDRQTGVLDVQEWGFIEDPDGPGTLATMGQFGADVETAVILRGNVVSVAGREPKLLLGLDRERDWVWKVGVDGELCWGDPSIKGRAAWDVCLERVDESGFEYPRFTVDADDAPVTVDIKAPLVQGTGSSIYGPAYWGISDWAAIDTGSELCASADLSCEDVLDLSTISAPTDASCGAQIPGGVKFLAFCK